MSSIGKNRVFIMMPTIDTNPKYFSMNGKQPRKVAKYIASDSASHFGALTFFMKKFENGKRNIAIPIMQPKLS